MDIPFVFFFSIVLNKSAFQKAWDSNPNLVDFGHIRISYGNRSALYAKNGLRFVTFAY